MQSAKGSLSSDTSIIHDSSELPSNYRVKNLNLPAQIWDLVKRIFICFGFESEGSLDRLKIFNCFELPKFWSGKRIVEIKVTNKKRADSTDREIGDGKPSSVKNPSNTVSSPAVETSEKNKNSTSAKKFGKPEGRLEINEPPKPAQNMPTAASKVEIASSSILKRNGPCFSEQVSQLWTVRDPREPRKEGFKTFGKTNENRLAVNTALARRQQESEDSKVKSSIDERTAEINDFLNTFDINDSNLNHKCVKKEFNRGVFKDVEVTYSFQVDTVREKDSGVLEHQGYSYGISSAQGKRPTMEDNHIVFTLGGCPCFVIVDGHGGYFAVDYCAANMERILNEYLATSGKLLSELKNEELLLFFKKGFILLNEAIEKAKNHIYHYRAGTTVALNAIIGERIICVNLGDSRTVIINPDGTAVQISTDMKCDNEKYTKKAKQKGFFPEYDEQSQIYRIDGLAVPRDMGYGSSEFSPVPTLSEYMMGDYMIIACDGLWDVITPVEAAEFVAQMKKAKYEVDAIAQALVKWALKRNSADNISVMVVKKKS